MLIELNLCCKAYSKLTQKNFIYKTMEFNDRADALFCDPNAYIQNWGYNVCEPPKKNKKCEQGFCQHPPKKVVFSEPYETVPNFYINNDFKKGNCSCIPKPKPKCPPPPKPFPFDIKNLLPLLSGLMKNNSGGLGNILSMLNNNNGEEKPNFDISSLISSLSNSGALTNLFNVFKPKEKSPQKEITSTDYEIKNYTRVE